MKKEKSKYNPWENSAYMVRLAWNYKKSVIFLCVLGALLEVVRSVLELYIVPVILEKIENQSSLRILLGTIGAFILGMTVISGLQAYVKKNQDNGRVYVRVKILQQIHYKFCTTSFPHTEDPEVLKKASKAGDSAGAPWHGVEAIWKTLADLIRDVLGLMIYLGLLSTLDIKLLVLITITTILGYLINQRVHEWEFQQREQKAEYTQKIHYIDSRAADITLAKDLRIFRMKPWLHQAYQETLDLYKQFIGRCEKVSFSGDVLDAMLAMFRNGIGYYYLISMLFKEGMPISAFLLYFSAVNGFTSWMTGILTGVNKLQQQSLEITTVREFLELPELFQFEKGESLQPQAGLSYEIELRNVSFRYPGASQDTIHCLNLVIHPGENLAIVGVNGAGKTTLVKLICGLYDPTAGEVLLNGKNIKVYNRRDYYRMFSAVFQQFSVLEVSLAENIAQIDTPIDFNKARSCLEKAGLAHKLEELPQGFETHIGRKVYEDGIQLSGGEMQRLMLARALYKDAPVIVLDEPTAALDPIAENDIYLKYNEMTEGKTSLFISHRLASTRFCDRILLLNEGEIIEEGTHDALLHLNGEYAKLFNVQSKYYRQGGKIDE